MKKRIAQIGTQRPQRLIAPLTALLAVSLFVQPPLMLVTEAQERAQRAGKKSAAMSDNQRIAHVLSRLTFGARPGDFERVKAMGVDAFINQQLDPDSLDVNGVIARLKKLPTLGMATPVIIEQYNPPKPAVIPSPVPAKSPDNSTAAAQKEIAQNSLSATPRIASPNMSAMPSEMQMEAKKEEASRMPALPDAAPKPTPPPKNPQMVVTELQRAKLLRAVYSERQLYELMVDFWENHFSIFSNKDDDRYLLTGYDRETIRPF